MTNKEARWAGYWSSPSPGTPIHMSPLPLPRLGGGVLNVPGAVEISSCGQLAELESVPAKEPSMKWVAGAARVQLKP